MTVSSEPSCAKCGSAMSEGFILDNGGQGARIQSTWVEGAPKPSFWSGLTVAGQAQLRITTWRCNACGYLESYAPGP